MAKILEAKSTEQKREVIRQIIPELFQQQNFLSDIISKGNNIEIISLSPEKLSFSVFDKETPRLKRCKFTYDGTMTFNEGMDQESKLKRKWIFNAKLISGTIINDEKPELEISFIGDLEENNGHSQTDRIFLHKYEKDESQSILVDFKQKKIGISDKGSRGGYSLNRYNKVFSFDNVQNDPQIKRFEYNEVSKLIALILKNNKEIILPISINYDPSEKIKFLSDKMSESQISTKSPNGNIISKTDIVQKKLDKVVYVDGKKMILSGEDSNPTIKYGDLSLTFDQLRLIYYLFGRKTLTLNIPKVIPGVQPRKIKDILNDIIKNNHTVLLANPYSPDRIIIIFNEAARLGLISSKFIETFKTFVSSSI